MPKTRRKKKQLNPYDVTRATVKQLPAARADDEEEDNYECSQCSKFVDQVLQCECCARWYCCPCQNVSDKMLAAIVEFNSLHWYCADCEPSVSGRIKDTAPPQDQQCDIERRLQAMECKLTDLTNSINKITADPCPGTGSPQTTTTTTTDSTKAPNILALKAVDEYREREQRKLNLIFHKVPESTDSDPSSRGEQDLQFIHTLANELGVNHLEITNTIRLGQPRESGARLLKVTVSNLQSKRQLLSKAKNLRQAKSDQLCKVYITPDLSPQERLYQKNLRAELHRRRTAGEQNLVIRRGQIITAQIITAQAQAMDVTRSSAATTSKASAASVSNDQSG